MLDGNLKTQLKTYLERISLPVEIVASLDDSEKSREMLELLTDIETASGLITIDVRRDDAQMKPSFALRQPGTSHRADLDIREAGLLQGRGRLVKVLARGEVSKALTVRAHKFSGKAAEKISAAGGQAEAL